MGNCPGINGFCTRKWRVCRFDLDFRDSCCGLLFCVRVFGRDGFNVRAHPLSVVHELTKYRAPTSGGQYHWVSEFAPRKFQRLMSYMTGWVWFHPQCNIDIGFANVDYIALRMGLGMRLHSLTSFIAIYVLIDLQLSGIAGVCFFTAQLIEALIILNHPTFVPQPYHATLLIIAVAAFSIFFNTFLAKKLPLVEAILLLIHIAGFFGILIPLWTLAPRANAKDVFTTFNNGGGWNSEGTSALVGILTAVISLTGSDSAAHMCMFFRQKLLLRSIQLTKHHSRRDERCGCCSSPVDYVVYRCQRIPWIYHASHFLLHSR
jgi:hypothetical protein